MYIDVLYWTLTNVCVYGLNEYTNGVSSTTLLHEIFKVVEGNTRSIDFPKTITISLKKLSKRYPYIPDTQELNEHFTDFNGQQVKLLVWPAYDETCIVVFALDLFPSRDNDFLKELLPFILDNLQTLYVLLFSEYQSIWGLRAKDVATSETTKTEQAFTILSHEIGQHTAALSGLYQNNLENATLIRNLTLDKLETISMDFYSSMEMLDYLSQNSKIYSVKIKPDPSEFYAFGEKIFKFKNVFQRVMLNKRIKMILPQIDSIDKRRGKLYTDKILFEQILFNILRNALQYAHPSTYIHVDCIKADVKPETSHTLEVTNFGIELDETVDVYEMGVRGHEAENYYGRGTGIGLYIVKRIVEALRGEINHRSVPICKYNLPLIKPYLDMLKAGRNDDLNISTELEDIIKYPPPQLENRVVITGPIDIFVRHEIDSLQHLNIDPSRLNILQDAFKAAFINDKILMPTFETTFKVTIPPYTGG